MVDPIRGDEAKPAKPSAHVQVPVAKMVLGSAGLLVIDSATKGCLSDKKTADV